jgi:hypothetical protein
VLLESPPLRLRLLLLLLLLLQVSLQLTCVELVVLGLSGLLMLLVLLLPQQQCRALEKLQLAGPPPQ